MPLGGSEGSKGAWCRRWPADTCCRTKPVPASVAPALQALASTFPAHMCYVTGIRATPVPCWLGRTAALSGRSSKTWRYLAPGVSPAGPSPTVPTHQHNMCNGKRKCCLLVHARQLSLAQLCTVLQGPGLQLLPPMVAPRHAQGKRMLNRQYPTMSYIN